MSIMVTKQDFAKWFCEALEEAALNAETVLGTSVPRDYLVELYGAGVSRAELSIQEAVDKLFVADTLTWMKIDVAVLQVEHGITRVFVRASNHDPGPWERSFKFAHGRGPFDQLIYKDIQVIA